MSDNLHAKTKNLTCFSDGSNLIIQPHKYIEDGWFIEVKNGLYKVYEIPQYGGCPHHLRDFECPDSAIKYATNLT